MFGHRRKRGSSLPPLNSSNANPSAATAAASAYLKSHPSNASLSSAAAAAALRSRPTSPISVGDVQTKRMLRRAGSNSSNGSSVAGPARGSPGLALQRRGSVGSMSERTFRDPSPARGVPSAADAPPVPSIPKDIGRTASAVQRRTASEAPAMRLTSPPPSKATGRGSSLGPAITMSPPRRTTGPRPPSLSSVHELTGLERPESRGSVNFSLPTSSRPTSPVSPRRLTSPLPQRIHPQRVTSPTNSNMVYDPNTRSFLPLSEILAIEQRIQDAANKPTKKKKKRVAPKQNTGTHLADGTVGGRLRGTAIDEMEAVRQSSTTSVETVVPVSSPTIVPAPTSASTQATIHKITTAPATTTPEKPTSSIASDTESDGQQSYAPNSSDNESEFSSPPPKFHTRAGALLAKRPSIVREDREREEEEEDEDFTPRPAGVQNNVRLDTTPGTISPSPSRPSADRGYGRGQAFASATFAQAGQQAPSASQPSPVSVAPDPAIITSNEDGIRGDRVHSVSPSRTPQFVQIPDHLAVRHSPPSRSISPRKSALKQSSSDSPRGQSPASRAGFGYGSNVSETSNGSAEFEEQTLPRKKAVRVSFDENNVVVGRSVGPEPFNSSFAESPQELSSKRNWLSLTGRGKKKASNTKADDEIMQPRPALPSFGSVRERKQTREPVEERPLVKPTEIVEAEPAVDSTASPLGQSNDHAVGGIISQDAASKHAANISRSREPLPPQVTTVEGSGYSSDGDSTIGRDSVDQLDGVTLAYGDKNGQVPEIAISAATPPKLDETIKRKEWLDIPGSWSGGANSESGSPTQSDSPSSEHRAVNPTPATVRIAEPLPDEAQQASPVLGNVSIENTHDHPAIMEEAEESDATSHYSDAAEELSDAEGGFLSLDAVVDGKSAVIAGDYPATGATIATEGASTNQLLKKPSEPSIDEGWDQAQRYWNSLSADKKLRLEQEAREEAEASDSTIEAPISTPKPKKKKKSAAQAIPLEAVPAPQPVRHDRSYMIAPGSKATTDNYLPTMRLSMRPEPLYTPPETHMRMSMRNQGFMRNSMRQSPQLIQQKGSLVKKNRPMSLAPYVITPDPAAVSMHVRALSVGASKDSNRHPQMPTLRRKGSGDSDSSFKRTRAADNTTYRRSMRGSLDDPSGGQQSPTQSSRFSLRSLSPTGSGMGHRAFSGRAPSSNSQGSMRTSLRSPAPTKPPLRIPGFGRVSSQPPKGKPTTQRTSRFADSSDEEDDRPAFRSRFADSSDDDDNAPAPSGTGSGFGRGTMRANQAVRAIPRKDGIEDGDSSDLPDSDDEPTPGTQSAGRQNGTTTAISAGLRRPGSGRDAPISPTAAFPAARSRGGNLMAILRRKKPDPSSKVRKADVESAARRDTPLERSRSDLQAMRRSDSYNLASPKLQKRNANATWPLPPSEPPTAELESGDIRPHTADGADRIVGWELSNGVPAVNGETDPRPELAERRFTAQGIPGGLELNDVSKGPKKKFGKLRRMFKLDD